jgi:lipopolysaccharide biosynthesis protein
VIVQRACTDNSVDRAMIFAHWDPNGLVDDHVLYALERYRPWVSTLVFVSTNYQRKCRPLEKLCDKVIVRENTGFDLVSWKVGLEAIDADQYDEVVFTNDSIYGPLKPLDSVFLRGDVTAADLWGMTISEEHERHLQSYFFAMKRRALLSEIGKDLWTDVSPEKRQRDLVEMYEMQFLKEFERGGFRVRALFDGADAPDMPWSEKAANFLRWPPRVGLLRKHMRCLKHWPYNPTHLQWRQCMEAGVPFLKVDLFRDNPNHLRLGRVRRWIAENTDYPVDLIRRHQSRLRRN